MNAQNIADFSRSFRIGRNEVGENAPTYFIADIAANHDGDLSRAKALIHLAAQAGADAAKFQHFSASTIISDFEFRRMPAKQCHQSSWRKSVYDVYADASLDRAWTLELKATCDEVGIEFMTSPYSHELVDAVDPYLNAYKIGSGDITWNSILEYIATKNKPIFIATGASTMDDVVRAMDVVAPINSAVCLMQCNTNYTGSIENFNHLNLRVLRSFREMFPHCVLGLSDHTPGHAAVLGAVALGAKAIEKHFTDDRTRSGPDHAFSMTASDWRDMVDRTRELERALGNGIKRVEANERQTAIIQRRALCAARAMEEGETVAARDLIALRPCPPDAFAPHESDRVIGRRLRCAVASGQAMRENLFA